MGRKDTVITRSEKNSEGPTSLAASRIRGPRGASGGACSMCLWAFSIMITAASTITPMARAMPPRLMMLALMPASYMMPREISTPRGRVTMATRELRKWSRKMTQTRATTIISSMSLWVRFSTARLIRLERS